MFNGAKNPFTVSTGFVNQTKSIRVLIGTSTYQHFLGKLNWEAVFEVSESLFEVYSQRGDAVAQSKRCPRVAIICMAEDESLIGRQTYHRGLGGCRQFQLPPQLALPGEGLACSSP